MRIRKQQSVRRRAAASARRIRPTCRTLPTSELKDRSVRAEAPVENQERQEQRLQRVQLQMQASRWITQTVPKMQRSADATQGQDPLRTAPQNKMDIAKNNSNYSTRYRNTEPNNSSIKYSNNLKSAIHSIRTYSKSTNYLTNWPIKLLLLYTLIYSGYCTKEEHREVVDRLQSKDVIPPTKCEACSIVARDLMSEARKKIVKDEMGFIELSEDFCNTMLEYKLHKENLGIERFNKEESGTFKTLKTLKDRGVKIVMDLPYELWDEPPAEVSLLKQQCELILSNYEDELQDWFIDGKAKQDLNAFLCENRYLTKTERDCLISSSKPSNDEL